STTRESNSHSGTNGHLRSGRKWYSPAELSVEEERRKHHGCNIGQLYHAGHHECRQRLHVPGSREQLRRERNQQRCDADSERSHGGANDHSTTRESNSHSGTNGHLRSGRKWYSPAELSVEEEWRKHHGCNIGQLYHAGHHECR